MSMASVSVRRSICWPPDPASESTDTLVLTGGKTGVFLDIRFLKDSNDLDWAFAGYRHEISKDIVEFKHHIDSRTLEPLSVIDRGTNSSLEEGVTLEIGEMINPKTGLMTPYEEVWEEKKLKDPASLAIFLINTSGTAWQAQVDCWQMALGRDRYGKFWAWQAVNMLAYSGHQDTPNSDPEINDWVVVHSNMDGHEIVLLPSRGKDWVGEDQIDWNGDSWTIIVE